MTTNYNKIQIESQANGKIQFMDEKRNTFTLTMPNLTINTVAAIE